MDELPNPYYVGQPKEIAESVYLAMGWYWLDELGTVSGPYETEQGAKNGLGFYTEQMNKKNETNGN